MKATFACPALVCLLGTIFCRAAADYAPPPFEHYQPILDRMPFGSLPADFGKVPPNPDDAKNAAQAAAEQQKLAKQVNMSAVTVTPDGNTAIGFTDLSAKPPVNHFLLVGESADGWTVTSADYDDELATIEKDGVSITLKLGKGLVDPSTLAEKAPAAAPAPPPARHTLPPAPGAPSAHGHPSLSSRLTALRSQTLPAEPQAAAEARSYKDRLLERENQQTQEQLAQEKKRQEALVKLAREAAQKEIARREEEAASAAAAAAEQQQEEIIEMVPAAQDGNVQ